MLDANTTYAFSARLVGRRTDVVGTNYHCVIDGTIKRDATAASTAIDGSINLLALTGSIGSTGDGTSVEVAIAADTSTGALTFTVTAPAAQTNKWYANVNFAKVS